MIRRLAYALFNIGARAIPLCIAVWWWPVNKYAAAIWVACALAMPTVEIEDK